MSCGESHNECVTGVVGTKINMDTHTLSASMCGQIKSGFTITDVETKLISIEHYVLSTDTLVKFDDLQLQISVQRHSGAIFFSLGLPCMLIQICSWMLFFINTDLVPALGDCA